MIATNRISIWMLALVLCCQGQNLTSHKISKRQAVAGAPCTAASDLTPATTDCKKFQRCANGMTYLFDCGPGTIFNPTLKVCDWPTNTPQTCQVSTTAPAAGTAPSTTVTNGAPAGSSCTSDMDLTPWSTDCTKFQRCANGILYVFNCGPGTVFLPVYRVCGWPANPPQSCTVPGGTGTGGTGTGGTGTGGTGTTVTTGPSGGTACTSNVDLTPWSTDCTKFQRCANGMLYVFDCAPGTVFLAAFRVCGWPANPPQSCTVPNSSGSATQAPTAAPTAAPTVAPTAAANTFPNCFLVLTPTDRTTYCADGSFFNSFRDCCP